MWIQRCLLFHLATASEISYWGTRHFRMMTGSKKTPYLLFYSMWLPVKRNVCVPSMHAWILLSWEKIFQVKPTTQQVVLIFLFIVLLNFPWVFLSGSSRTFPFGFMCGWIKIQAVNFTFSLYLKMILLFLKVCNCFTFN